MLNNNMKDLYPEMIKKLPEADIDFKGVRGWISQGKDHQIVFFDIEPIGKVTEHSHMAQWGIVRRNAISNWRRDDEQYN